MKQGHFAVLFSMIFCMCFLELQIEQKRYDRVWEEKQKIENALVNAIEYTAWELTEVIFAPEEAKKKAVEDAFFEALSASLGYVEDTEAQAGLKLYVPLLILVEADGALIFHLEEKKVNNVTTLCSVWADKTVFSIQEESSWSEKKAIISNHLEKETSEFISNHNYIARQYGLEYIFSVPNFLYELEDESKFPMIIAVLQGWPLTASGKLTYENCIDAAAYIQEKKYYWLELPKNLENTVCYFHNTGCEKLSEESGVILERQVTEQEAIWKYGAVVCEICAE